MIAHRLGLIPLKADLKNYNFREKCKCKGKGCSRCQASFALKEVGPKMVRAGDLKPRDPAITPIYPEMPVVELLEGQEIELEAIAVLGVGKDHAKFSPCLATYQHFPLIKINPRKCKPEKCNYACISACPKGILIGKEKARIDESKLMECHLCKACEESCPSRAIDVRGNSTKFIFYLESWGQLAPREIVSLAIDKLIEKLKQLNKLLKRVKKKK
jgi:DNA-directed RNA polymerase subunit D